VFIELGQEIKRPGLAASQNLHWKRGISWSIDGRNVFIAGIVAYSDVNAVLFLCLEISRLTIVETPSSHWSDWRVPIGVCLARTHDDERRV